MTEEKFQKIEAARKEYFSAKQELNDFRVLLNPFPIATTEINVGPSKIVLKISDGRNIVSREITIDRKIAEHFYNQEVNRLMAKVHFLKHEYEKL